MIVMLFMIDDYYRIPTFKHLTANEFNNEAATHMTMIFHTFVLL